jgi:hypothetical protein
MLLKQDLQDIFDEEAYLAAYPDVGNAVAAKVLWWSLD